MNQKVQQLMEKNWEYGISRNLSVWHDDLHLKYVDVSYKRYRTTPMLQCKIHRGFHSDFYYLATGIYSREYFFETLEENFLNPKYIEFLKKIYKQDCEKLLSLTKTLQTNVSSYENFFENYGRFTPMLDITSQASKFLTLKIVKLLEGFSNISDIITYYSRPKDLAPIQKMEKDIEKYVKNNVEVMYASKKLFQKYAWIPANFVSPIWDELYFVERLKNLKVETIVSLQKPSVKISSEAKYYLALLGEVTALNEYRKSIFSRVNVILRQPFTELAEKNDFLGWEEMYLLTSEEIVSLLKKKKIHREEILKQRQHFAIYNPTISTTSFLSAEESIIFEKKFLPHGASDGVVKGLVANRGKVIGKVKIILSPEDFSRFEKGDILVAKMTSVDCIPIMKKAAAFVTNEGGLGCHAAVIAREYGKPCIVGTKNATFTFQNGDFVEVDAEKGIVRKI